MSTRSMFAALTEKRQNNAVLLQLVATDHLLFHVPQFKITKECRGKGRRVKEVAFQIS